MKNYLDLKEGNLGVKLLWLDSMGAKSTCTFVQTPDVKICIDPGVAVMQPSYPLPDLLKKWYKFKAERAIRKAAKKADLITTSHYHYDHLTQDPSLYEGKELWIKDPNQWINKSQWNRSRDFLELLAPEQEELEKIKPKKKEFKDPYKELKIASNKDFGNYQDRREELLKKWRNQFKKLTKKWASNKWIKEPSFANYADGKKIKRGSTKIKFKGPLFHGIEYSKTGWLFSIVVEHGGNKFIHSSDLQGPTIEDYAEWIIQEDPDILVLDGPATYLYGFLLNKTNLKRSINNAFKIANQVKPSLMVWDHHLLRDKKYKERTRKVWDLRKKGINIKTAAEVKGKDPLIFRCTNWTEKERKEKKEKASRDLNR